MKVFTHTFGFGNKANSPIPSGISLFLRVFLFVLGVTFIISVVILGISKVSDICLPYLAPTANTLILIFLFCIYPLSLINRLRPILVFPSVLIGSLLGACAWVYSLLFVVKTLGFWGILFCFLFQTLTPITLIGAVFTGSWEVVGTLTLWLILSFIIKFFSATLRVNYAKQKAEDKIIDVEVVRNNDENN